MWQTKQQTALKEDPIATGRETNPLTSQLFVFHIKMQHFFPQHCEYVQLFFESYIHIV